MNCKRLKFIMEMVFIFILPLLFILPCIKIKDNYVYDNEGNYQVSEKVVEFVNPLNLTTNIIETKTIYNPNDYIYVSFDDYSYDNDSQEFWDFIEDKMIVLSTDIVINFVNNGLRQATYWASQYNLSDLEIVLSVDDYSYADDVNIIFSPEDYGVDNNYIYLDDVGSTSFCVSGSWFKEYFYDNYPYTISFIGLYYISFDIDTYDVITDVEDLNLFGQIKKMLVDNLHIQSNTLIDLLITYTFLWFVMFIIWHLFYMFVDFLLHFWRKEDD